MSGIKIKELVEKTDTLNDEDLVIIEDSEDTKKITLLKLRSAFSMDGILTATKNMILEKVDTFIQNHSTKYKDLEERNAKLEVLCHNLQNDHYHDATRIFDLEDKLVKQTKYITTLQNDKNRLVATLSELQQEKDILSEKITVLNKQVTSNESSIIVLKSQVKDLQLKAKELKSVNDELQEFIDALETDSITSVDKNFEDINSKLSEYMEDIMAYIRYYHPDVDNLNIK